MKKRCFIIVFILSILVAGASYAQPVASFSETIYDFGEAPMGEDLEHTFTITNTGTSTLVIEKVTSS